MKPVDLSVSACEQRSAERAREQERRAAEREQKQERQRVHDQLQRRLSFLERKAARLPIGNAKRKTIREAAALRSRLTQ